MGKKDTVTAKYMRKNQVFADAFNYYVYHGEQKIHPEELVELDTKEIKLPYEYMCKCRNQHRRRRGE